MFVEREKRIESRALAVITGTQREKARECRRRRRRRSGKVWLSSRHEGVLGVREGGEQEWRRQGEGGLGETREAAKLARQCGQSFAANPEPLAGH